MKKVFGFCLLTVFLLLTPGCKGVTGEDDPNPLSDLQQVMVSQLNGLIHAISGSSPDLQDGELNVLDYLKDARIVGLGEATHGTKDFFQMKHRVFKYLVEHHGYRAFGFECDFAESIYLDRYITTGVGDLRQLMKDTMHFWTWETEEVYQLLAWMRQYNQDKSRDQMIRYIGFDCQFQTYQGDFLIEYLDGVDPGFLATVRTVLENSGSLGRDAYEAMTQAEFDTWQTDFQSLYDEFVNRENQFTLVSGQEEYEIAKQLARTLIQTHKVRYSYNQDSDGVNWRDTYMAENSLWLADFMGDNAKVVLWAHNGHLANNSTYGGDGSMGRHLKDALGTSYQILGFSFSMGSFNAVGMNASGQYTGLQKCDITSVPPSNSINFLFHHANPDRFIFILDRLDEVTDLNQWLLEARRFLSIGAVFNNNPSDYYYNLNLRASYDVIMHFDVTTEAEILQ
jgi:erythromycin esterase